jgi:hypothetical protein
MTNLRGITLTGWLILSLAVLSAPAWGQAVTFADLEGAVVDSTVISRQVIRREGREVTVRLHNRLNLVIGPGNKINATWTTTSHTPRGVRHGKPRTISATLERPREATGILGPGHAVWIFNEGTLTNLRTYKGGAFRGEITFVRDAKGFTCARTENYARENGRDPIVLNSAIDGVPLTLISNKQISSTCTVTK